MAQTKLQRDFVISDLAALRDLFPQTHPLAIHKCQTTLDKHSTEFIRRSPFLCISTQSADRGADVSPRGDPPGFVKILDEKRLIIPDRPGNNRLDTLENILTNPSVGLLFLIPGFDESMRINGRASITNDPALLARMAINERLPRVGIMVEIDEVFIHCAKAFRRSKLWDVTKHQNRDEMPSIAQIILDQTTGIPDDPEDMAKIDADIETEYRNLLY